MLPAALEEELKVFCVITVILLVDYFPLFLHFLISLIKFILWLKFFQTRGRWRTWGVGEGVSPGKASYGPDQLHLLLFLVRQTCVHTQRTHQV